MFFLSCHLQHVSFSPHKNQSHSSSATHTASSGTLCIHLAWSLARCGVGAVSIDYTVLSSGVPHRADRHRPRRPHATTHNGPTRPGAQPNPRQGRTWRSWTTCTPTRCECFDLSTVLTDAINLRHCSLTRPNPTYLSSSVGRGLSSVPHL